MKKRTLAHENDWYYNNYIMRLLIVEDENDLRNIVKKRLVKEHYSVDACGDGLEAMDYIDMTSYDGIILDIMLPGKDGYEILRELRRREDDTPVLLLTAKDSIEAILISHSEIAICNIMRFYDDGCTEEFYNPTDNQEVLEGIRRFDTLNQPSVCNKLFDAKLFANISFPYGKFYEDTYVYHELLYKADKVVLTGKTGYWYLSRKGSILGRSQFSNRYFDFIEAVYMRADFLIKRDIQPYGDEAFLSLYAALANAEKNIDHKLNKDDFHKVREYYRQVYNQIDYKKARFNIKQIVRIVLLRYFPGIHSKLY